MTQEKKRQHFVPKFYLKTFSQNSEAPYYLSCYDLQEDKAFGTNIKNIAQGKYFYDLSDEQFIENKFEDLENIFSRAYSKLVETADVTNLNPEERNVISLFISHQHIRTRKFREVVKQASEHTLDTVDEEEVNNEDRRKAVEAGTTEQGAKQWQAQLMANALQGFADILNKMDWFLFVNKTKYPLWTSDHPIAIFNPINPEPDPKRGIERPGSRVHVPLSPDLVLALYDPMHSYIDNSIELTEKDQVDCQNKLQVKHCHRQVYSLKDDFELAREIIDKYPEYANPDYSDRFVE